MLSGPPVIRRSFLIYFVFLSGGVKVFPFSRRLKYRVME